ncbi:MAG TPA: hypothetical protein VFD71_03065 [Planctomycetota bacterium]|nr:hypothetical protein [Planctomycetota bacterium]
MRLRHLILPVILSLAAGCHYRVASGDAGSPAGEVATSSPSAEDPGNDEVAKVDVSNVEGSKVEDRDSVTAEPAGSGAPLLAAPFRSSSLTIWPLISDWIQEVTGRFSSSKEPEAVAAAPQAGNSLAAAADAEPADRDVADRDAAEVKESPGALAPVHVRLEASSQPAAAAGSAYPRKDGNRKPKPGSCGDKTRHRPCAPCCTKSPEKLLEKTAAPRPTASADRPAANRPAANRPAGTGAVGRKRPGDTVERLALHSGNTAERLALLTYELSEPVSSLRVAAIREPGLLTVRLYVAGDARTAAVLPPAVYVLRRFAPCPRSSGGLAPVN